MYNGSSVTLSDPSREPSSTISAGGRAPLSALVSFVEILATLILVEATIWASGRTQLRLFWLSAAFIVITTVIHRPTLDQLGLAARGFRPSLWVIPAALALSVAAGLIAWDIGSLHPLFGIGGTLSHSTAYVLWAVFQQFILQSYVFLRLERLLNSGAIAALVSAGIFCLVHIPNPVLVVVCLIAGWVACLIFRRNRNIYALGVAHGILGLTIALTIPDHVQRHMRVGAGYYSYALQHNAAPPTPFRLEHR
jgi:hypothetical protein